MTEPVMTPVSIVAVNNVIEIQPTRSTRGSIEDWITAIAVAVVEEAQDHRQVWIAGTTVHVGAHPRRSLQSAHRIAIQAVARAADTLKTRSFHAQRDAFLRTLRSGPGAPAQLL